MLLKPAAIKTEMGWGSFREMQKLLTLGYLRLRQRTIMLEQGGVQGGSVWKQSSYCELEFGTCHQALHGLNHELLQLSTSNTARAEFRVKIRSEALCVLGKLEELVFR